VNQRYESALSVLSVPQLKMTSTVAAVVRITLVSCHDVDELAVSEKDDEDN